MSRRPRALPALAALAVLAAAAAVWSSLARTETRAAPPADVDRLLEEAARVDGLLAVAARRDGRLAVEGYFDGTGADDLLHLRSGTKSVISLLIGIALDRGDLDAVDQTLGELLGARVAPFGPRRAALTLEHLLTMSAGLRWNEGEDVDEFNRLVTARDPVAHYLERPFVAEPGAEWAYSSGASHLLSAVLEAATGLSAADYARRHLFAPLGIERYRWPRLADGHSNGGAGLQLRPRDTLALGQLLLDGGSVGDRRVVSPSWLEASTRARFTIGEELRYGYHWWILDAEPFRAWLALGYAGQTLAVLPEGNVVMLANCRWRGIGRTPDAQSEEVQRFLADRVAPFLLPALAARRDPRTR